MQPAFLHPPVEVIFIDFVGPAEDGMHRFQDADGGVSNRNPLGTRYAHRIGTKRKRWSRSTFATAAHRADILPHQGSALSHAIQKALTIGAQVLVHVVSPDPCNDCREAAEIAESEMAIDAVPPLPGCPYVFYNPATGTRWRDCRKPWINERKAAVCPWMTPKYLRPSFPTNLSEMGLETHFVSELLGHSSARVTEEFYIKRRQVEACRQALRIIEGGKRKAS